MENPSTPSIDLGGLHVRVLSGGSLRLDGGAMFGIIPRNLWARSITPDEQNRIALACNCLLLEFHAPAAGNARRVLIETGHGPKYREKEAGIFAIDPNAWLVPTLAQHGVAPDSIDAVIVSHLHFDHAGGLTHVADGELRRAFPNARVHVQRREFDDARANFGIMNATYREENYTPIDAADAWNLCGAPGLESFERAADNRDVLAALGASPILPGVWPIHTPGHTRGHQSILICGSDQQLVFVGDVLPTRHHLGPPYNMGYDLLPLENRETKRRLLTLAARHRWLLALDHDVEHPLVRAVAERDWFRLEPL